MDDHPSIDYWADRNRIHPAIRAAIEFLAQDHNWACTTWYLADAARRALLLTIPEPRTIAQEIQVHAR